ncbi:hypothetical protein MJG53_007842 [Ovis ammon polii x Ovis aries]|uniref:Uncharacterized protein n=1 Tax=Ovis ammon polii x Ovis aries TaxID=2918886 RepID=A0ACB9V497_9CETA|nr:hypothetical protein MJT46_007401 [Ovis ammon polii x Ovis aries]KAI4584563.1 hypothetical protein MJG53_007842 [Ovis ammon polii x Ovis aries]
MFVLHQMLVVDGRILEKILLGKSVSPGFPPPPPPHHLSRFQLVTVYEARCSVNTVLRWFQLLALGDVSVRTVSP